MKSYVWVLGLFLCTLAFLAMSNGVLVLTNFGLIIFRHASGIGNFLWVDVIGVLGMFAGLAGIVCCVAAAGFLLFRMGRFLGEDAKQPKI